MRAGRAFRAGVLVVSAFLAIQGLAFAQDAPLPAGVRAVWDMAKAQRDATPTRERVCINGLWRWQPAAEGGASVPAADWGFFKVPGCWPGITDYMQKDSQTVFPAASWRGIALRDISSAWYQREIAIPAEWAGRRISLRAEYVNSSATVFLDGREAGTILFPGGELDLTAACSPGSKQLLSLLVKAMPLKAVMLAYTDTNSAREVKGSVARRGLCGDVWLVAAPKAERIASVKAETSVRKWEIKFRAALEELRADEKYTLKAKVFDGGDTVKEFSSEPFTSADLSDGRYSFTAAWKPAKLWDTNTPGNMYSAQVSLADSAGKLLDVSLPERFGFREFWISGRDFYLNGSRIFLSAVPLDNAQVSAAAASYEGAKETLLRLKSFGINFVYTHNYDCEPGSHLSFAEALRAADDVGMLVALSQPHFSQYDWRAPDADANNGYARHAAFYVGVAQNHPSVVAYAMSHNATGYVEDMNPDKIDGLGEPRTDSWSKNGAARALRAQGIVRRLDPERIVYHHSSGNLGAMHTDNFYPNFAPIQELDDWFGHWATVGVKPLFLCEFAAPSTWDFAMYRGWYKGAREWGSAVVPWELCLAEWNSQFFGDSAFRISEVEKACLRWESKEFRSGALWHRWDYPYQMGTQAFAEQYPAIALYIADNWRALRTWGVSAINPGQYSEFWKMRPGAWTGRRELAVDWDRLQRPGFSADFTDWRNDATMATGLERSDWIPTPAAQALLRNNMPLLAYIGGRPAAFTSKDHNFLAGDAVLKQLIIINDSREPVTCDCGWSLGLPQPLAGTQQVAVGIGDQARVPLRFELPHDLAAGRYELNATVKFSEGESQEDSFAIDVMAAPAAPANRPRIALFDPKGETAKLLREMGAQCIPVDARADLAGYDLLVVGKGALTADGPGPDLARVRDGLRVVVFEQTSEALEKRLGFRTEEYGLRQVFKRVPDHPLLAGLDAEELHDWRGEATLLPPRLDYRIVPAYQATTPTVEWCGMDVPRVWRCGCRGNVASVLIEKPARGDFMPILDGGYSLQYSPLMEYREGRGMVLFCQMDVTGRTESDPAALTLAANIMRYAAAWVPSARREAVYVGDPAGKRQLERAGIAVGPCEGGNLSPGQALVVGAGGGKELAPHAGDIAKFLKAGGNLLALGLDEQEANSFLPSPVRMTRREHIAAFFEPFGADSLLAGIGPADVHDRGAHTLPLVSGGATIIGDGVLAKAPDANVVFCQLLPWQVTRAEGAAAGFEVDSGDAPDGKRSALVTLGTTTQAGGQFGQRLSMKPAVGKTYTFAVLLEGVGGAVTARLEVERAGRPWDRAVKGSDTAIPENEWTDLHATFQCEKAFPEGWQAYVACAQDGGRFRARLFRLYEGEYVPWQAAGGGAAAQPKNFFANPSFENGTRPYFFQFGEQYNLRRTYRRASFLLTRLLADMGVAENTPLLGRFGIPVAAGKAETRWLDGLYLDQPESWDDPYRFFCW